jgi:D-alanine-D-alanine ligase-like ATP-grasp enzyme
MLPNKPKPVKHIPALSPERLTVALDKLKQQKNLSPAAKRQLEQMMRTAANPNNDSLNTIIKTMPKERQTQIKAMAVALTRQTGKAVQRGNVGLDAISSDEWERLVNEANNGQ